MSCNSQPYWFWAHLYLWNSSSSLPGGSSLVRCGGGGGCYGRSAAQMWICAGKARREVLRRQHFSSFIWTLSGLFEQLEHIVFLHKSHLHLVNKGPVFPPLLANRLTCNENHSFKEKPITWLARTSHLQGLALIGSHVAWQSTAVHTLILLSA